MSVKSNFRKAFNEIIQEIPQKVNESAVDEPKQAEVLPAQEHKNIPATQKTQITNHGSRAIQKESSKTIITEDTHIDGSISTSCHISIAGVVTGNINCDSSVYITGKIHGNVSAGTLEMIGSYIEGDVIVKNNAIITSDSIVVGNISAYESEINSNIKGNIKIETHLILKETANILGDISATSLEVKNGAIINGRITVLADAQDIRSKFADLSQEFQPE